MPLFYIGYGRNRRDWDEDDPALAASVCAEIIYRLGEDAQFPQQVMATAMAADSVLAGLEALHLDTMDTLIWRRALLYELLARLEGTAHLVFPDDDTVDDRWEERREDTGCPTC